MHSMRRIYFVSLVINMSLLRPVFGNMCVSLSVMCYKYKRGLIRYQASFDN